MVYYSGRRGVVYKCFLSPPAREGVIISVRGVEKRGSISPISNLGVTLML